jgi:hypothetical protein
MCEPLYFSLRETAYADPAGLTLGEICDLSGAATGPLAQVYIPVSGAVTRVSALWAAEKLRALYPGCLALSVGATECRVFLRRKQPGPVALVLKTLLLCAVMFFGGAVAIMTFHEDVNMPAVLGDVYAFFTGGPEQSAPVVSIPYSIGVVAGFAVLMGLVHRKRHKPTLLELSEHEQDKQVRDYIAGKDDDG